MNIVIFAGGTGSIALQTGLYQMLDSRLDGVDTKIIVNAYDNGLSTGAVRKVCEGKILGPSDVRKNQTTRLKLENPGSEFNNFLDIRFTAETQKAKDYCLRAISDLTQQLAMSRTSTLNHQHMGWLQEAVEVFFSSPVAGKIDYTDFSLANIIYAGFAKANGNSLRKAASIMSMIMGIKDNVILNDDTSLFLGAITKSGIRVTDEGDIVSWGNTDDPFVDIFFVDANGNERSPLLCDEAKSAIADADLIILSSGTQWSSLIPTYASLGFKEAIERTSAKIMLVMNRQPDKDSPSQSASDIVRLLVPKYFSKQRLHLVIDVTGHAIMSHVDDDARSLLKSVTEFGSKQALSPSRHDNVELSKAIGTAYFSKYLLSHHFMFDYDDTLVGRGNKFEKCSNFNKAVLTGLNDGRDFSSRMSICTGNTIKAISLASTFHYYDEIHNTFKVYADGGVNLYDLNVHRNVSDEYEQRPKFVKCVNNESVISKTSEYNIQKIFSLLQSHGIPYSKIENRGDVMVCIKPISEEYRTIAFNLIKLLLKDSDLVVREAGRSTIEICKDSLSKKHAVIDVLNSGVKSITYVGDEIECGNDADVEELHDNRVACLRVKNPVETAFFLTILSQNRFQYE